MSFLTSGKHEISQGVYRPRSESDRLLDKSVVSIPTQFSSGDIPTITFGYEPTLTRREVMEADSKAWNVLRSACLYGLLTLWFAMVIAATAIVVSRERCLPSPTDVTTVRDATNNTSNGKSCSSRLSAWLSMS